MGENDQDTTRKRQANERAKNISILKMVNEEKTNVNGFSTNENLNLRVLSNSKIIYIIISNYAS